LAAIGARPRRSVAIAAKAAPTTQDFIGPVQKMMRERPVYASHRVQSFTVGARWRTAGTRKIGGFNSLWTNTMNRCSKATRTTIFIASCALVASAGALFHPDARAERGFPAKTQRGEMTFTELPDVVLNGKAERLVQTCLREWAYARSYANSEQRAGALPGWLHHYNWHRLHASLGYKPPITRIPLNNVLGLHN